MDERYYTSRPIDPGPSTPCMCGGSDEASNSLKPPVKHRQIRSVSSRLRARSNVRFMSRVPGEYELYRPIGVYTVEP